MLVNTGCSQQKQKQNNCRKGQTCSFKGFCLGRSFFCLSADSVLVVEVNLKVKISLIYKARPEGADAEARQLSMNTGIELSL